MIFQIAPAAANPKGGQCPKAGIRADAMENELGLGVPRVVELDAFGQQAFATPLASPGKRGASAFGAHARAKTVLSLARAFRSLISTFHKRELPGEESAYVKKAWAIVNEEQQSGFATTRSFWNKEAVSDNVKIEPATEHDLDELSGMLGELFSQESDFRPNKDKQLRGLRLIFEEPNRGRVFVLRRDNAIVGMINLLFTISTAEGGFVVLLEDLIVHQGYRGHGYGSMLLEHAVEFAKQKNFLRITLLTDRPELRSQVLFRRFGFHESAMMPMRLLLSTGVGAPDMGV